MKIKMFLPALLLTISLVLSACAASPTATEPAPSPTATPASPDEAVQGFWDAMTAADVASAMEFVSDEFTCRGSCYFSGKTPLQAYLQGYLNSGNVTTISNLRVEGTVVTYDWEIIRNGVATSQGLGTESMTVEAGKIIHWQNLRP